MSRRDHDPTEPKSAQRDGLTATCSSTQALVARCVRIFKRTGLRCAFSGSRLDRLHLQVRIEDGTAHLFATQHALQVVANGVPRPRVSEVAHEVLTALGLEVPHGRALAPGLTNALLFFGPWSMADLARAIGPFDVTRTSAKPESSPARNDNEHLGQYGFGKSRAALATLASTTPLPEGYGALLRKDED